MQSFIYKSKKIHLFVIFLFIFAAIFVVWRWANNLDDWSICYNQKAGYELRYPSDWNVYGDGSTDEGPQVTRTTPCSGFGVSLRHEYKKHDFETPVALLPGITIRVDYPAIDIPSVKNGEWKKDAFKTIEIDGTIFYFVHTNIEHRIEIIGLRGNQLYTLSPHQTLDNWTLQKLLSTFHFIDTSSSP